MQVAVRSLRRDASGPGSGERSSGNWEAIFNRFCPAWSETLVNTPLHKGIPSSLWLGGISSFRARCDAGGGAIR